MSTVFEVESPASSRVSLRLRKVYVLASCVARSDISFVTVYLMCVPNIVGSVKVAEWQPVVKKLLPRLTICFLCIIPICCFSYFPF